MKIRYTLIIFIFLITFSGIQDCAAQSWNWVLLGQTRINYNLGQDVIVLGAREGRYNLLQVQVAEGSLNVYRMEIEYRDGLRDELEVNHYFKPGDDTQLIELRNYLRIIKQIRFWYDTDNYSSDRTTLLVFGRR